MTLSKQKSSLKCGLCSSMGDGLSKDRRCEECICKGDMVGKVVWKRVAAEVVDVAEGHRVMFMIVGLSAKFIEGISRNAPNDIKGRTCLLVVHPKAAEDLHVDSLTRVSDEPATHWRHSDEAEVILFATTDEQLDGVGAGLGPVARIDEDEIIDQVHTWCEYFDEAQDQTLYLRKVLQGLKESDISTVLDMWIDFILEICKLRFSKPVYDRIQCAAYTLHIPNGSLYRLPNFDQGISKKITKRHFSSAFNEAKKKIGVYAYLQTPNQQQPVDPDSVRQATKEILNDVESEDDSDEIRDAIDAIERLLEDAPNIRPGLWLNSQKEFCKIDWDIVGRRVFEGSRNTSVNLGEDTLKFLEDNYSDDLTDLDKKILSEMPKTSPKEPRSQEIEFYERWRDPLGHNMELTKKWQKRVFPREISRNDLLSTLSDGFEALLIAAGEGLLEMETPKVLIRAAQHKKMSYWKGIDTATLELFRFEMESISGILGEEVGFKWDLDACLNSCEPIESWSAESRRVELDLYLIDSCDLLKVSEGKSIPSSVPRVRLIWKPSKYSRQEPISYALPGDIFDLASCSDSGASIFRQMTFSPRADLSQSRAFSATLEQVSSFTDVFETQFGRTFHAAVNTDDDILQTIKLYLHSLQRSGRVSSQEAKDLEEAIDVFDVTYREAMIEIGSCPKSGFKGNLIYQQARAFGSLCKYCRKLIPQRSEDGRNIRKLVTEIGVIKSKGLENMAIMAAWHPLRLAERRARVVKFAEFTSAILDTSKFCDADLSVAFQQRRALSNRWVFPETAVIENKKMVSVQEVGGYALLKDANDKTGNYDELEQSAPTAAEKLTDSLDRYLDIYPHEATSLSTVLYESNSDMLPLEVARLVAKRMRRNSQMRCDLTIAHSSQARLRALYEDQSALLQSEDLDDILGGFLSRLRIDVQPLDDSEIDNGDKNIDLAFLNGVLGQASDPEWTFLPKSYNKSDSDIDISGVSAPRHILDDVNAEEAGTYLTLQYPPQVLSEFYDLLYEIEKSTVLPEDYYAVLVKRVRFCEGDLRRAVANAHGLANWVVTFDSLSIRSLLKDLGVEIIRDISTPGFGNSVIISQEKVDNQIIYNMKEDLRGIGVMESDELDVLSDWIVKDVRRISGQKLLAAARFSNSSREMIGLSVMRAIIESCRPESEPQSIWLSLDDYRSWFVSGKSRTADALAVTILDKDKGFTIRIQVGEAKFVSKNGDTKTIKDARSQVAESVKRISAIFVDNKNEVSRKAWCLQLAELLFSQEDMLTSIPIEERRSEFLNALLTGEVLFEVCGEAVICLHDDGGSVPISNTDSKNAHIRWHILPAVSILNVLRHVEKGSFMPWKELLGTQWYGKSGREESAEILKRRARNFPDVDPDDDKLGEKRQSSVDFSEKSSDSSRISDQENSIIDKNVDSLTLDDNGGNQVSAERLERLSSMTVLKVLKEIKDGESSSIDDSESRSWAEEICRGTQRALSHFDMHAEFSDPKFRLTPNGVLVCFCGHPTLTVSKVEKRKSEMLTTHGIDVVDIRPGPGTISLFVKREPRAQVPLASTWLDAPWPDRESGDLTNFVIGVREDDGNLLFLNLAGKCGGYDEHGPHTLIAGETGSGKGILTQGLLLQLVAFNDPKNVELVLVDPKKGVDFAWLDGFPHMREEVVTEKEQAQKAFDRLVQEMDRRYDLFRKEGVSNIARYNSRMESDDRLPRIVLVHDELGSWMAQEKNYRETVLSSVSSLGMEARAAGIHLVLITQRADADAVPPRLRDNMNNRLCLRVQNSTGSRMVLDTGGAERLLGKGHLACQFANQEPPVGQSFFVVQVPYADPDDMERLAEAAKSHWGG